MQILLLELSGATLLLLDEPTDNLDLVERRGAGGGAGGASRARCSAVTHDRWFARVVRPVPRASAPTAEVYESDEPVWDEGRVVRAR